MNSTRLPKTVLIFWARIRVIWEKFIYAFITCKQLGAISKYIPTSEPQLDSAFYEVILLFFLKEDHSHFLEMIKTWPSNIYSIKIIIHEVRDALDKLKRAHDDSEGKNIIQAGHGVMLVMPCHALRTSVMPKIIWQCKSCRFY